MASHTRAVLSSEAVTTRLPSGLNLARITMKSCPESVASAAPDLPSYSHAVPCIDAVTMLVCYQIRPLFW